ncbi:uncharacterized protein RSE6_07269 [Rhynchosporium secalis]|uniref:2EXR domain-containing protein n=1 Tax=Rhynchosporium secalis TaxID=38038 RepID=A0A1E1MCE1_RHYSE|nr:uncharacterized protein RSE6_07269 [Rhynchosporium secalis]
MEVPMPTQTFHPFPRLPLELRREIYKLTIASVPRMSDITEIRFENYSVSEGEYAWSMLTRLYIIPKRSKSCALLFVSTESRDFAQKELEPKMLKLDPKRCAINYRTFSDREGAVHESRIGVFHSAENAKQHVSYGILHMTRFIGV